MLLRLFRIWLPSAVGVDVAVVHVIGPLAVVLLFVLYPFQWVTCLLVENCRRASLFLCLSPSLSLSLQTLLALAAGSD